ncbi:uncharacterized protein LOC142497823 [Ascaphus truei]|uniref:uncharacterized protein LOC142497823 n=1 Tax=Ascaphus truei TaxID=8439 RepID=UPI003F5A123E
MPNMTNLRFPVQETGFIEVHPRVPDKETSINKNHAEETENISCSDFENDTTTELMDSKATKTPPWETLQPVPEEHGKNITTECLQDTRCQNEKPPDPPEVVSQEERTSKAGVGSPKRRRRKRKKRQVKGQREIRASTSYRLTHLKAALQSLLLKVCSLGAAPTGIRMAVMLFFLLSTTEATLGRCAYTFPAPDLMNQTLVFKSDLQEFCTVSNTSTSFPQQHTCPNGCKVTLINRTTVVLETKEGEVPDLVLEHGKPNKNGKPIFPSSEECRDNMTEITPTVKSDTNVITTPASDIVSNETHTNYSVPTWAIVLIISLAVVVVLALLLLLGWCIYKRRKSNAPTYPRGSEPLPRVDPGGPPSSSNHSEDPPEVQPLQVQEETHSGGDDPESNGRQKHCNGDDLLEVVCVEHPSEEENAENTQTESSQVERADTRAVLAAQPGCKMWHQAKGILVHYKKVATSPTVENTARNGSY